MLGMIHQELASELKRILSGRVGKLVDEALEIDRVLVVVHPTPEAGWYMRIAHSVIDQQVRNVVAKGPLRTARIEPLKRGWVSSVLQPARGQIGKNGLTRDPHMQAGQVIVGIEGAHQLALRDRMAGGGRRCPLPLP